jgi:hypothetical protein
MCATIQPVLSGPRIALALAPLVAVGCDFSGAGNTSTDAGGGDGDGDAIVCDPAWTPINFELCAAGEPSAALTLGGGLWTYDTDSGVLTAPDSTTSEPSSAMVELDPPVRVLHVEGFALQGGAELELAGVHPLIIASASTIAIDGFVDAASIVDEGAAGAQPPACDSSAPGPGGDNAGGAGGGGGGGNQAPGGDGGTGDTNNAPTDGGVGGGIVGEPATPRGGCRGGAGGEGDADEAPGGAGGGAVQLSAAERIDLGTTALIAASGGGGIGGDDDDGGGGGGGSGGFIGLDAPEVNIAASARVIANGGGGGGGAATGAGGNGDSESDSEMPAQGGPPGTAPTFSSAGPGGDGGSLASPGGESVTAQPTRGNGGGGGGVGYVLIWSSGGDIDAASIISPVALQPGRP